MARMHTGKHGKAKSRKPVAEQVVIPEGAPSKEEAAKLIADYAKQGMHHAAIGQKLRDEHSIPYIKHYFGKRLHVVLEEEKVAGEYPQDFMDLLKRAVKIRRHLAKNKNDKHNTTSLRRVESKIWRMTKYYKMTGAIPEDWKYDPEKAALIVKGS